MRHSGGKCIHVLLGAFTKPKEGQFLVTHDGCLEDRLEFQLWPSGILILTRYGMCVKPTGPVTDGVRVGKKSLRYISGFERYFLIQRVNAEREQTDMMDYKYGVFNLY
jgi:hypothetical protein